MALGGRFMGVNTSRGKVVILLIGEFEARFIDNVHGWKRENITHGITLQIPKYGSFIYILIPFIKCEGNYESSQKQKDQSRKQKVR